MAAAFWLVNCFQDSGGLLIGWKFNIVALSANPKAAFILEKQLTNQIRAYIRNLLPLLPDAEPSFLHY